jgi:tRNA(adenine34) deaminase
MNAAHVAAREALERGNFPIGAAVVIDGELVATGANAVDSERDDTRHAEMVALARCAPAVFDAKRTRLVELFTTMEPCAMCFGAIAHFRIGRVVSALDDGHAGAVDHLVGHAYYGNSGTEWVRGFMAAEARVLLEEYQERVGVRRHLQFVEGPNGTRIGFRHGESPLALGE